MDDTLDWSRWPNFSADEFRCRCKSCGGELKIDPVFLDKLQAVRSAVGFAMKITSGYRCPKHSAERKKKSPGAHASGVAADIRCNGRQAFLIEQAFILVQKAAGSEWIGMGRSQRKGRPRFVHLDIWENPARPNVWSY